MMLPLLQLLLFYIITLLVNIFCVYNCSQIFVIHIIFDIRRT